MSKGSAGTSDRTSPQFEFEAILRLGGETDLHLQRSSRGRAELLLRPVGHNGSRIDPGAFVRSAHSVGYGRALDLWVARQAMTVAQKLANAACLVPLAINVSPATVRDPDELLAGLVAPIRLEVTEDYTAMLHDETEILNFAESVIAKGCSISLDDLSEVPHAVKVWGLFRPYVAEIKLDLGPNTRLRDYVERTTTSTIDDVTELVDIVSVLRSAIGTSLELTLERGDNGVAARFIPMLHALGIQDSQIARQDFDVHKPEPVDAYIARYSTRSIPQ